MANFIKKAGDGSDAFSVEPPAEATVEQKELASSINAVIKTILDKANDHPLLKNQLRKLADAAHTALGSPSDMNTATALLDAVRTNVNNILEDKTTASAPAKGQPSGGIYVVISGTDPAKDRDLRFVMARNLASSSLPADQMALKAAIDDTLLTLKLIFPSELDEVQDPRFIEYRQRLIGVSELGLSSSSVFPGAASQALDLLRAEIVAREAGRVKNDHMMKLGWQAIVGALAAAGIYFLVRFGFDKTDRIQDFRNFLVLWSGCMLGTWLSFGARRVVLKFEDLGRLEADLLYPWMRLLFAGSLTIVLGLVFATNMINVQIGELSTAWVLKTALSALVVGVFCGLSEQALPGAVSQRAAQFFSEVEKRGGGPVPRNPEVRPNG